MFYAVTCLLPSLDSKIKFKKKIAPEVASSVFIFIIIIIIWSIPHIFIPYRFVIVVISAMNMNKTKEFNRCYLYYKELSGW